MDTHKKFSFLTYTPTTLPPAQLWIGHHEQALDEVEKFLQHILCKNNSCNTCITCMQIREKQHHALMWLHPEKNYTLDQLEDIFATLSFQLQPNELFFFIIQKADFLTSACANKLLKPIEEPPRGYHFILLAERAEQILPTIRSRCIIHTLDTTNTSHSSHPLFECFTTKIPTSNEFAKIIDTAIINERESIELLNQIMHYWFTEYHQEINSTATNSALPLLIITKLQQAQLQPPMPGSYALFWRNLYLQTYNELKNSTILIHP
jgi:DNA polymerase III gamma/tau subunit